MKFSAKQSMIKRFLCIALTVVIIAGFVPVHANASSVNYKVTNLQQNTTITALPHDNNAGTYHLYKISVPKNGFIKIVTSNRSAAVRIYKSINWNEQPDASKYLVDSIYDLVQRYVVLPKGTYYLAVREKTKLKWTFTSMPNKTNYCRGRAATLNRGKKTMIAFNYGYEYDKWYKIKITNRKKITISLKPMEDYYGSIFFTLVNSRGIRVNSPQLSRYTYQTAVVPAGVYYICLERSEPKADEMYYYDRLCQLSWK